jgi:hypothetical protein
MKEGAAQTSEGDRAEKKAKVNLQTALLRSLGSIVSDKKQ